jgi:hypothetical protein
MSRCRCFACSARLFLPPSPKRAASPRVGPSRRGVFICARTTEAAASLVQVRCRQMPMLPDRNNPQAEAGRPSQEGRDIGGRVQASGDDEDDRTDNRRGRQKIDPQDGRDFGEKEVPDRVSASAADCAHHDGGDGRQSEFEGFFRARHPRAARAPGRPPRSGPVLEFPRRCGTRRTSRTRRGGRRSRLASRAAPREATRQSRCRA